MKRSLHQRWSNIAVNVALAALVVAPVYAATTVGSNTSTDGNIIINVGSGKLGVGTTTPSNLFSVHGNAIISGNVTSVANVTATGTLAVTGATTLSSTLGVTGASTFTGLASFGQASSTRFSVFDTAYFGGTATSTFTSAGVLSLQNSETISNATDGTIDITAATTTLSGRGIFTTGYLAQASSTVVGNLTVTGTLSPTQTAATTFQVGGGYGDTGATIAATGNIDTNGVLSLTGGTINLGTGSATSTFTSASGFLGIGTTTPAQLFSVHGNSYTSGTSYFGGAITATSTLTLSATSTHTGIVNGLGLVGAPSFAFTGDLDNGIWSSGADTINFSTAGAERARIDTNGRLGIGTTTPGTPLSVTGAAVITGTVTTPNFAATSTTATSTLSTGGLTVGTNQFLVQQTSGNVGVGTTTPGSLFSVHGNALISNNLSAANITATGTLTLPNSSTGITGVVFGFCNIANSATITASSSAYFNCTGATGVTTSHRVFVQATSSMPADFVVTAASSTAADTINLQVQNLGQQGGNRAPGAISLNFWGIR